MVKPASPKYTLTAEIQRILGKMRIDQHIAIIDKTLRGNSRPGGQPMTGVTIESGEVAAEANEQPSPIASLPPFLLREVTCRSH